MIEQHLVGYCVKANALSDLGTRAWGVLFKLKVCWQGCWSRSFSPGEERCKRSLSLSASLSPSLSICGICLRLCVCMSVFVVGCVPLLLGLAAGS